MFRRRAVDRPVSALSAWRVAGGRLGHSLRRRAADNVLYPYYDRSKLPALDPLATFMAVATILGILGFLYYFQAHLGRGRDVTTEVLTPSYSSTLALVDDFQPVVILPSNAVPTVTLTPIPVTPVEMISASAKEFVIPAFRLGTVRQEVTPIPVEEETCLGCESYPVAVRVGWFYPPLGGSHCLGKDYCADDGLVDRGDWFLRQGKVAACPTQFSLGSFVEVPSLGVFECAHRLDLAVCEWFPTQVCSILVLSPVAMNEDWRFVYEAVLWTR